MAKRTKAPAGFVKVRTHVRTAPGRGGKASLNERRTKFRNKLPKGVKLQRQKATKRKQENEEAAKVAALRAYRHRGIGDALVGGFPQLGGILGDMAAAKPGRRQRVGRKVGGYKRQGGRRKVAKTITWRKFFSEGRAQGKSAKEIGAEWRRLK